jgi:hypothetical protein
MGMKIRSICQRERVGEHRLVSRSKSRQLGDTRRDPPRLVLGEHLRRRSPTGLFLKIDIGELLTVAVLHDEAGIVVFLDRPGRREATGRQFSGNL